MRLFLFLALFASSISFANTKPLPSDIEWLTDLEQPEWGSNSAQPGGIMRLTIASFPPTLRTVGPDANNSFRNHILDNQLPLVDMHPNNKKIIPILATHWAYGKDGKTVYYKINPNARWSDGKPVIADDFLFALEFMRSKEVVAPWYNKHYSEEVISVDKYDSHTISITGARKKPKADLHYFYSIAPRPSHFHRLSDAWVREYNWRIEPNTGPYQISKVKNGKSIEFSRKTDWWAKDNIYLRNRFNVDRVIFKINRDPNSAFKYFERGEIDAFNLTLPKLWHEKSTGSTFKKGFIKKLAFYNQTEQNASGLFINTAQEPLNNIRIRQAIAHAINYDKVISGLLYGDYERLPAFHTGYGAYSNPNIQPIPFDVNKASAILDAEGWFKKNTSGIRIKNNRTLSVTLSYGNKLYEQQILVIADEAKKAGIELKPFYQEGTSFYKSIREKKHDIAFLGWSTGFRPAFWQHFHSDNANKPQTNNITNISNKEIDTAIESYRSSTDEAQRIRMANELASLISNQSVFIPGTMVPFTRAGYWRWFELPEIPGTKSSKSLFNPFNVTYGGMFWINSKVKVDTLSAKRSGKGFGESTEINTQYKNDF